MITHFRFSLPVPFMSLCLTAGTIQSRWMSFATVSVNRHSDELSVRFAAMINMSHIYNTCTKRHRIQRHFDWALCFLSDHENRTKAPHKIFYTGIHILYNEKTYVNIYTHFGENIRRLNSYDTCDRFFPFLLIRNFGSKIVKDLSRLH